MVYQTYYATVHSQISSLIRKNNFHYNMAELEKYINNIEKGNIVMPRGYAVL